MEEWKAISKDYKGVNMGKIRQCFAGCITNTQHGTQILTEGVDFEIVKEKDNASKD